MKLTSDDFLLISTALIAHRKILEGIQQRISKREIASNPDIAASRQRHIYRINEILAKIERCK